MLYRKIKAQLEDWLEKGTKALMITGARQVGKTFLIEETLKERGVDFFEINFLNNAEAKRTFDGLLANGCSDIGSVFSVLARRPLPKGAIIFLDEVQEVKEMLTVIKFLVLKNHYRYILSGSLLGVELNDLRSAPVGYLSILEMFPLDLEEFLRAEGLGEEAFAYLRSKFEKKEAVDEGVHKALIDSFYRYLVIGGMPEAVQKYRDEQDLDAVRLVQEDIVKTYHIDFTKYEKKDKLKLIKTYDLIPNELNSKNKRYSFSDLDKNLKFDRYENSFDWLIEAGVAIPVYNVTEFELPLEASKKSNLFKLFLSDVGLLSSLYGPSTILSLLSHGESINCGAIFENFVAQELRAHGFKGYYFNSKKHGEVDFLIEHDGALLPIEVKSGKDYQTHSALTYFMSTPYFKNAIVLSVHNVSTKGSTTYYPIYMSMFLNNNPRLGSIEKADLSSLRIPLE